MGVCPTGRSSAKGDINLDATHWQMSIQDRKLDTRCPEQPLLSLRVCAPYPKRPNASFDEKVGISCPTPYPCPGKSDWLCDGGWIKEPTWKEAA